MAGTDRPILYYTGIERGPLNKYFGVKAGETFPAYSLVFLDTATGLVEICGADPALILGVAQSTAANKFLYPTTAGVGRIPVQVLDSAVEYGMSANNTLAATNVGVAYGVVKLASGNWVVDLADTTNTRVHITRVDVDAQIAVVQFLAANLQLDAVLS